MNLEIIKRMKDANIKNVSIGFSTGKDSLVGYDILKKAGFNVIPIFYYIVPDLNFVEDNIRLYERYYNMHIIRLPHPILFDYCKKGCWQDPFKYVQLKSYFKSPHKDFDEIRSNFFKAEGIDCEWNAVCMKMADSLNRRLYLRDRDDIDLVKKYVYITKYFTTRQIWAYINEKKLPISSDYEKFGVSFDGLTYHFSIAIKRYYPKDWEKIKEMFPLIELEILRYKAYEKKYDTKKCYNSIFRG